MQRVGLQRQRPQRMQRGQRNGATRGTLDASRPACVWYPLIVRTYAGYGPQAERAQPEEAADQLMRLWRLEADEDLCAARSRVPARECASYGRLWVGAPFGNGRRKRLRTQWVGLR